MKKKSLTGKFLVVTFLFTLVVSFSSSVWGGFIQSSLNTEDLSKTSDVPLSIPPINIEDIEESENLEEALRISKHHFLFLVDNYFSTHQTLHNKTYHKYTSTALSSINDLPKYILFHSIKIPSLIKVNP